MVFISFKQSEAYVRKGGSYPTVTRVDVKSVCMAKPSLCKRIGMSGVLLIRAKGQLDVDTSVASRSTLII